jgi:hypothetical protein
MKGVKVERSIDNESREKKRKRCGNLKVDDNHNSIYKDCLD